MNPLTEFDTRDEACVISERGAVPLGREAKETLFGYKWLLVRINHILPEGGNLIA